MSAPIELPMYAGTHPDFRDYATDRRPLRPSALGQLLKCPMSGFLVWQAGDELGNTAAQTGNLVHSAAAEFHRTVGDLDVRTGAGLAALQRAREEFPGGDPEKAVAIYTAYSRDPKNQTAVCLFVEEPVTLRLAPAPDDPTGEPIVIRGTLDQVRLEADGRKRVYDIKTGSAKDYNETLDEYILQQAAYTLAARQQLDPDVLPGEIIYTPGYERPRGRRFLPLSIGIPECYLLMQGIVSQVALIRRGVPIFTPSAGSCKYCPVRPYTNCLTHFRGVYA